MKAARRCARCVMDDGDRIAIDFDEQGVCSFCRSWQRLHDEGVPPPEVIRERLRARVEMIRAAGRGKAYDCVLGVSGGVDSTYLAFRAKDLGLRPLLIHMDNGWNSELAVKNIESICRKLSLDLHTHVVAWEEFRDLHRAYLKASVIDVEVPTDHAINAILLREAARRGIRYVLSGANVATEGLLPSEWVWNKMDLRNLEAIHRRHGRVPLRTFPRLGFWRGIWIQKALGVRNIDLLDLLEYDKPAAAKVITAELGWRDYGGKHHESIFTRFYQGYILPTKFGVDKRKAHLSSLICAGQVTRQQALDELARPPYAAELVESDKEFVIKKLELTPQEFEEIMKTPARPHLDYPSYLTAHYLYHRLFFSRIRPITALYRRLRPKPAREGA